MESLRLVRSATKAPAGAAPPAAEKEAGPPGEEGPATPSQANLVVLLFDKLPIGLAPYAQQGALDLLKQRFPPNTWFAVFKVDTEARACSSPSPAMRPA